MAETAVRQSAAKTVSISCCYEVDLQSSETVCHHVSWDAGITSALNLNKEKYFAGHGIGDKAELGHGRSKDVVD
jgi:hypothetical protein